MSSQAAGQRDLDNSLWQGIIKETHYIAPSGEIRKKSGFFGRCLNLNEKVSEAGVDKILTIMERYLNNNKIDQKKRGEYSSVLKKFREMELSSGAQEKITKLYEKVNFQTNPMLQTAAASTRSPSHSTSTPRLPTPPSPLSSRSNLKEFELTETNDVQALIEEGRKLLNLSGSTAIAPSFPLAIAQKIMQSIENMQRMTRNPDNLQKLKDFQAAVELAITSASKVEGDRGALWREEDDGPPPSQPTQPAPRSIPIVPPEEDDKEDGKNARSLPDFKEVKMTIEAIKKNEKTVFSFLKEISATRAEEEPPQINHAYLDLVLKDISLQLKIHQLRKNLAAYGLAIKGDDLLNSTDVTPYLKLQEEVESKGAKEGEKEALEYGESQIDRFTFSNIYGEKQKEELTALRTEQAECKFLKKQPETLPQIDSNTIDSKNELIKGYSQTEKALKEKLEAIANLSGTLKRLGKYVRGRSGG